MFSLSDLARTQYVVFNIQDVLETDEIIPEIGSIAEPRKNTDVSEIILKTENLLQALTADTLQESDQNLSLGEIYSVGYGISYAQNRAILPRATFLNVNGGIVTKGYVGNNAIALPGTTGTLILP
jgi:hypothetical protein